MTKSIVTFIPERNPQWSLQTLGKAGDISTPYQSADEQKINEERMRQWPRLTLYVPFNNSDVALIGVQYAANGELINRFYLESKSGIWYSMGFDHILINKQMYALNLKKKELQKIQKHSATVIFKLVEISELGSLAQQPDEVPPATLASVVTPDPILVPSQPAENWDHLKTAFQKRANRFFQNRQKKQELLAGCEKLQDFTQLTQLTDPINPNEPTSHSILSMFNRHRHTPRHNHYFARSLEPLVRDHALLHTPLTLKLWLDGYVRYLKRKSNGTEKWSTLETAMIAAWEQYKGPQDANNPNSIISMLTYAAQPGNPSILDAIMLDRKTNTPHKMTAGYKALLKQFPTLPRDLATSVQSLEMKTL